MATSQIRKSFFDRRNLITVAVAFTAGAGNLTLKFGAFEIGGIGTATFGAIIPIKFSRGTARNNDILAVGIGGAVRSEAGLKEHQVKLLGLTRLCRATSITY